MEFMDATASEEQVKKFALRAGDVIITKDSETADDIAIAAYVPETLPGVICGYHLSMIRPQGGVSGAYVKRIFDSIYAKSLFAVRANGLTRVGLSQYAVDNVEVPLPPSHEQLAIATFLNRETTKIDALIAEQQRLIELLQEKRQAVISHAVTKGLNPEAPMKDSGVEWLGEVPEHWEISSLSHVADLIQTGPFGSQLGVDDYVEEGISVINPQSILEDGVDYSNGPFVTDAKAVALTRHIFQFNDIVLARRGEMGRCAVIGRGDPVALCGTGSILLRTCHFFLPEYLRLLIKSDYSRSTLSNNSVGSTLENLSAAIVGKLRVPKPPKYEQINIVDHVDLSNKRYSNLICSVERSVRLLQERRSALISAAVTGQIDVRGLVPEASAA
jgi:type I restriction enzyme S subunit